MKTRVKEMYIVPEVRVVEAIVEKGFLISAIVINQRYGKDVEEHVVDPEQEW